MTGTTAAVWQELAGAGRHRGAGRRGARSVAGDHTRRAGHGGGRRRRRRTRAGRSHPGPWLSTITAQRRTLADLGPRIRAYVRPRCSPGCRQPTGPPSRRSARCGRPATRRRRDAASARSPRCRTRRPAASCWSWPTRMTKSVCSPSIPPRPASPSPRPHWIGPDGRGWRKLFGIELDGVAAQRLGTLSAADLEAVVADVPSSRGADWFALGGAIAGDPECRTPPSVRQGAPAVRCAHRRFQAVAHLCVDMYSRRRPSNSARGGVIHVTLGRRRWCLPTPTRDWRLCVSESEAFAGRRPARYGRSTPRSRCSGGIWFHLDRNDAHLYLEAPARLLGALFRRDRSSSGRPSAAPTAHAEGN